MAAVNLRRVLAFGSGALAAHFGRAIFLPEETPNDINASCRAAVRELTDRGGAKNCAQISNSCGSNKPFIPLDLTEEEAAITARAMQLERPATERKMPRAVEKLQQQIADGRGSRCFTTVGLLQDWDKQMQTSVPNTAVYKPNTGYTPAADDVVCSRK
jgi:hypothetical protein